MSSKDGGRLQSGAIFSTWLGHVASEASIGGVVQPGEATRWSRTVTETSRALELETVVIDGYVHLKPEVGRGLGAHLAEALPYRAAIIGVGKSQLPIADRYVEVHRGRSRKPLFVSAAGCSLAHAAASIESMHGSFRIPTLLKLADAESRRS
jgi:deoxyinosine 3'endonuclease (endonuclease V)